MTIEQAVVYLVNTRSDGIWLHARPRLNSLLFVIDEETDIFNNANWDFTGTNELTYPKLESFDEIIESLSAREILNAERMPTFGEAERWKYRIEDTGEAARVLQKIGENERAEIDEAIKHYDTLPVSNLLKQVTDDYWLKDRHP